MRGALVCLSSLMLVAGACTPLYVAPALNAPMMSESGEVQAFGTIEATNGAVDGALAFSPVDRFAVAGAVSTAPRGDDKHEHTYGEFAAGTYLPFGIGRLEAYLGAGYGDATGEITIGPEDDRRDVMGKADYARFFAQIDGGLTLGFLDLAGVMRASHLTFWHTASDGTRRTARDLFWEIGSVVRLGWTLLKFEMQMQIGFPVDAHPNIVNNVFQIAIGLHTAFDLY